MKNGVWMPPLLEAAVNRRGLVLIATSFALIGVAIFFAVSAKHSLAGQLQNCLNKAGDCQLSIVGSGHLLTKEEQKAIFPKLFKNLKDVGVDVAGQYTYGTHKYLGLTFPEGSKHRLFATCLVSNGDEDQVSLGNLMRACLSAETFAKKMPREYYFSRLNEVVEQAVRVGLTSLDDESFQPIAIENFVEGHRTIIELNRDRPSPKTYWEDKR
ncbi:MAG: hypothetical protein WCI55_10295 [Armatimonadota bacterium]